MSTKNKFRRLNLKQYSAYLYRRAEFKNHNTRIDFSSKPYKECLMRGLAGHSLKYISYQTGLTINQVVYCLSYFGISPKHYRDGLSPYTEMMLATYQLEMTRSLKEKIDQTIQLGKSVDKLTKFLRK